MVTPLEGRTHLTPRSPPLAMAPKPFDNPDIKARLIAAALQARDNAYCPYSNFPVGAALLTHTGEIVTGCNVENASYGLTICAERSAMTRAIAQTAGNPIACVVAGRTATPLTPCGACRQFLAEFAPQLTILCLGTETGGHPAESYHNLADLLPAQFQGADLPK